MTEPPPAAVVPARAGGWAYRMVRALARRMLAIEYRRVEVDGAARVPGRGAVLVVANHQNGLVDSLVLLAGLPRAAGPLAKAPLFRNPFLAPFLRGLGAVPVFRPQDAAENEGRGARANVEILDACAARLRAGEALVLFPEGVSHTAAHLLPLRTGASRIALDAGVPVTLVPVGLAFEARRDHRGTALLRVGAPFVVDGRAVAPAARRAAVVATTRRIEAALHETIAEADSHADLDALRVLEVVLAQERADAADVPLAAREAEVRRLARGLVALRAVDPTALDALRAETTSYARDLAAVGLSLDDADAAYAPRRVLRYVATTLLPLLLLAPIALAAAVVTWPARALGSVLALRQGPPSGDVVAFYRIFGQALVLVASAVVAAVVLGVLVAPWVGLVALVLLPSLFALHLAWRDTRARTAQRVRAFFLLAGGRLRDDLRARRRAIVAHVDAARERLRAAGVDVGA